jgi:hypothetical protein
MVILLGIMRVMARWRVPDIIHGLCVTAAMSISRIHLGIRGPIYTTAHTRVEAVDVTGTPVFVDAETITTKTIAQAFGV